MTVAVSKLNVSGCEQAGTTAMNEAIKQYRTNIVVKAAVDRVQLKNECCGSVTYVEWFRAPWTDDAYLSDKL